MTKKASKSGTSATAKKKTGSKPVTFRPEPELLELLEMAQEIGIPATDIINEALAKVGPAILKRESEARAKSATEVQSKLAKKNAGHVTGNG